MFIIPFTRTLWPKELSEISEDKDETWTELYESKLSKVHVHQDTQEHEYGGERKKEKEQKKEINRVDISCLFSAKTEIRRLYSKAIPFLTPSALALRLR